MESMRFVGVGFGGAGLARRAARLSMRGSRGGKMTVEGRGEHGKGHFSEVLDALAASKGVKRTDLEMKALVGETAGEVFRLLEGKGEVPLRQMKEGMSDKGPLAFMAVGWLLKEDKVEVKVRERGVSLRLK
jgi:hypothetical protein